MSTLNMNVIGYVGSVNSLASTPNGTPVMKFTVAQNRRWTGADGERREEVTWFNVTTWRGLAETCAQYVKKGDLVNVQVTRIKASPYIAADGKPAASLEVDAESVDFLTAHATVAKPVAVAAAVIEQPAPTVEPVVPSGRTTLAPKPVAATALPGVAAPRKNTARPAIPV